MSEAPVFELHGSLKLFTPLFTPFKPPEARRVGSPRFTPGAKTGVFVRGPGPCTHASESPRADEPCVVAMQAFPLQLEKVAEHVKHRGFPKLQATRSPSGSTRRARRAADMAPAAPLGAGPSVWPPSPPPARWRLRITNKKT